MVHNLSVDSQYKKWLVELKKKIRTTQIKAALAVNNELLGLYWELGKDICEKQRSANWGEMLIGQLANDLSTAFPGVKGFSRRNLFYIRKWYIFYNDIGIVQQVVAVIGEEPLSARLAFISQLVKRNSYLNLDRALLIWEGNSQSMLGVMIFISICSFIIPACAVTW